MATRQTKLLFTELSDTKCIVSDCEKKIKQRLIEKPTPNTMCYRCWINKEAGRGHFINTKPRTKRIEAKLPVKNYRRKENDSN